MYHVFYYRALSKQYSERKGQSEFWTLTIDAHLLQAAIHWCMVFGSHGANQTHWKLLSTDQSEILQQTFRDGLCKKTGLNQQEWEQYWKHMKDFRDNYAAHRELNYSRPVPSFDIALKVAHFYDDWVRKVISPATFSEPSLELFATSLASSADSLASRLFDATDLQ